MPASARWRPRRSRRSGRVRRRRAGRAPVAPARPASPAAPSAAVRQPTAREAGALETIPQVAAGAHDSPYEIAPVVLGHREDRTLVDANVVRIDPAWRGLWALRLVRGLKADVESVEEAVSRVDR